MSLRRPLLIAAIAFAALGLAACATTAPTVAPAPEVDLQRFMGRWYVIGNIPTRQEREAYNAVETYTLQGERIETLFQFREGGFDAPLETMRPVATVRPDTNNAVWGMQFVWPIKAEYVIAHVDDAYTETIIARSKRDYAWIMARTPTIPAADLERLKRKLVELGYSLDGLRIVPQQWPETGPEPRR